MLNISRSHKRFITLPSVPEPVQQWRSLYSSEWTSDRLPRQLSVDFLGWAKDHGAKVGLPDAYRVYQNPFVSMGQEQQVWLADVLGLAWIGTPFSKMTRKAEREEFIYWWRQYLQHGRCFTDKGNAWDDGKADYIQGKNLGAKPMGWETLILGGNPVDVLDDGKIYAYPEKYLEKQGSYRHYRVRCVNPNRLPPPEEFLVDPYVCHTPTTIRPDGIKNIFPQFDGRAVYPLWKTGGECYIWDRLIGQK